MVKISQTECCAPVLPVPEKMPATEIREAPSCIEELWTMAPLKIRTSAWSAGGSDAPGRVFPAFMQEPPADTNGFKRKCARSSRVWTLFVTAIDLARYVPVRHGSPFVLITTIGP